MTVVAWAGMALFVIASIGAIALPHALVVHRTDIGTRESPYRGQSFLAQLNYMNPKNYDEHGRRQLRWLYLVTGLQVLGALLIFVGIAGTP